MESESEKQHANTKTENPEVGNCGKILFSDVEVRRRRSLLWRKWSLQDAALAASLLVVHALSLLAPFYFNWAAFGVFVALYVITGIFGVTLSYHRNLAHRSFRLPKWLEYFFAYWGVQAFQWDPIYWVSVHRYHHQFTDTEKDPHSPHEGFWFSHIGWIIDSNYMMEKCGRKRNVKDLKMQTFYRLMARTYIIHPIALGYLLYTLGGFPFIVWGMGVRIVWVLHITFLVNSASHVWGKRVWKTRDLSLNNWFVALLSFGEGWHNNHHAFEYSARHGLEWWQIDMTWYVVRFLEVVGLATDVKVPTEMHKQKMALDDGSKTN